MYIIKVAVWRFSPYTYLCNLAIYRSQLCNSMLGLSLSFNREEIILDAWLGQELVFNNEIAA